MIDVIIDAAVAAYALAAGTMAAFGLPRGRLGKASRNAGLCWAAVCPLYLEVVRVTPEVLQVLWIVVACVIGLLNGLAWTKER